jgi:AcrR family transcriptional regulator
MGKPPRNEEERNTREKLLKSAEKVFAEKGFHGATVKAIADEAGCNVSLISYHFEGKEGLFRVLLEGFGQDRLRDAEKILQPAESAEDLRAKLRLWIQQFLLCHVQEASICSILDRENILEEEFLWDIFEGTFLKAFHALAKFLEHAKKSGLVRKDVDTAIASSFLFGSLSKMGHNQKIQKKIFNVSIADEKYRNFVTDQFVSILLNGLSGSNS